MGLLETLRAKFNDCITTTCRKENCTLDLNGINHRQIIIVDNDLCNTSGEPLCDYVLFYEPQELIISCVELKSGKIDASHAIKQITNGAKKAEELSKGYEAKDCIPLLLRGKKRVHVADIKIVQRARVVFKGKKLGIIVKQCGDSFMHILKEILLLIFLSIFINL